MIRHEIPGGALSRDGKGELLSPSRRQLIHDRGWVLFKAQNRSLLRGSRGACGQQQEMVFDLTTSKSKPTRDLGVAVPGVAIEAGDQFDKFAITFAQGFQRVWVVPPPCDVYSMLFDSPGGRRFNCQYEPPALGCPRATMDEHINYV